MNKTKMMVTAIVATLIFALAGCAKDGAQGPAGAAGANGTNGTNGNANVKVFYFDGGTLGATSSFLQFIHVTGKSIDSSLVLVYYNPGNNFWYPSPGLGAGGAYQTRSYTTNGTNATFTDSVALNINIYNPDGSAYTGADVTLTKVKAVVVPGSSFGKTSPVDYSDYKATMKYYGLKAD